MAQPSSVIAIRVVLLLVGVVGLIVGLYLWWKHRAGKPRGLNFWRRFFRMSRRDAIVLGLVLLGSALFMEFTPETWAIAWHIRHGRTAKISNDILGTYGIPVPMLWSASHDFGELEVNMTMFPGRFRSLYRGTVGEAVSISFAFGVTPGAVAQKDLWRVDQFLNMRTKASTRVIAGQLSTCFERRDPRLQEFLAVDCVPTTQTQGLSVSFLGFERSLPHFYAILSQIRKKTG